MPLPYELTDFPLCDLIRLRRLAERPDSDVQFLLELFRDTVLRLQDEVRCLRDELETKADNEEQSEGDNHGGRPAFGKTPSEMKTVEQILEMHRAERSYGEIARILNKQGIRTATGKDWHPQTVSNVIARYGR